MLNDTQHQMRRSTEASQSERCTWLQTSKPDRAVTYGASTEQGGSFCICEDLRDGVDKSRGSQNVFGITTIDIAARCTKIRAEVLSLRTTPFAMTACRIQPGDTDPLPQKPVVDMRTDFVDSTDDLVPGDDWQLPGWSTPLDFIELRVADPTNRDLDPQLSRTWFRDRAIYKCQGVLLLFHVD